MCKKWTIFLILVLPLTINEATAIPVSASIELQADSLLSEFDGITITDHTIVNQSSTWVTLLDPLAASVSAIASDSNQTLTVSGSASATWGITGNSGNVEFLNFGYSGDAHNYTVDLRNGLSGQTWSYTFIADFDGIFSMTYDVSVVDNVGPQGAFGLAGWDIEWSGIGGGLSLTDPLDPTTSGIFSRPIIGGQIYTIGLSGGPSLATGSSQNDILSSHVQGNFSFAMVPEPSTVILFILGLFIINLCRPNRFYLANIATS